MRKPSIEFNVNLITSIFDIDGELESSSRNEMVLSFFELDRKLNSENDRYQTKRCHDNYIMFTQVENENDTYRQESYCIKKDETNDIKKLWDHVLRKHTLNFLE